MSTDQEVLAQFYRERPEYARDCNGWQLLELATRPLTVDSLITASNRLESGLLLHPDYEEAWLQFLEYNPEKDGLAFRREFFEKMREKELKREHEGLIQKLGEKFRGQSLERLRIVVEKRRVHGLTASQFHEERAAEAAKAPKKPREYDGFPNLPEFLVLPQQVQATKIDAAFLSRINQSGLLPVSASLQQVRNDPDYRPPEWSVADGGP